MRPVVDVIAAESSVILGGGGAGLMINAPNRVRLLVFSLPIIPNVRPEPAMPIVIPKSENERREFRGMREFEEAESVKDVFDTAPLNVKSNSMFSNLNLNVLWA